MKKLFCMLSLLCLLTAAFSSYSFAETAEPAWQSETPLSAGVSAAAAAYKDGKIYFLGGDLPGDSSTKTMSILDTKTGVWSEGKEMPYATVTAGVHIIGSKLYVVGGKVSYTPLSKRVQIYDMDTDTWTAGQDMAAARSNFASASVGTKIYTFGGTTGSASSSTADVCIYDTETNSWSTGAAMPVAKIGARAEAVGNKIYVMGGSTQGNAALDSVEIYDTETNTWGTGVPMPFKSTQLASGTLNGNLYVFCGLNGGALVNKAACFDLQTEKWTELPTPLQGTCYAASVSTKNKIYILGGTDLTKKLDTVQSFGTGSAKVLAVLLNIEETVQLSVSYNLSDNTSLTWSSSDISIASVDANGKVTAVGEGLAYISAKNADGSFNESIPVRVIPAGADSFRLAVHLNTGQKQMLHLTDAPETVTWSSFDQSIASVSNRGEVTAAKKGLAIIQGELEGETYQIYIRVSDV